MSQIITAFLTVRPEKLVMGWVLYMNMYLSIHTYPTALIYLQVHAV